MPLVLTASNFVAGMIPLSRFWLPAGREDQQQQTSPNQEKGVLVFYWWVGRFLSCSGAPALGLSRSVSERLCCETMEIVW